MSQHVRYVPKHAAPRRSRRSTTRRAARRSVLMSSLAVTATGAAVGTGVLVSPVSTVATLAAAGPEVAPETVSVAPAAGREVRGEVLSRAADRSSPSSEDEREEKTPPAPQDPRDIARGLLATYGFGADQFGCLDALWVSESDWRVDADNPTSSAYGIPQALTELHDLPAGYLTDAETQIRWGLGYIRDSYGSPCSAWGFKQGNGWY